MQTTISLILYELVCAFLIRYNIVMIFDDYDIDHFSYHEN